MRRPAGHAEMNHPLGADRKMRGINHPAPMFSNRGGLSAANQFWIQQAGLRHAAQTISGSPQKSAAVDVELKFPLIKGHSHKSRDFGRKTGDKANRGEAADRN